MAVLSHGVGGKTYTVSVAYPPNLDGKALSPAGAVCIDRLISLADAGKAAATMSLLRLYNETWCRRTTRSWTEPGSKTGLPCRASRCWMSRTAAPYTFLTAACSWGTRLRCHSQERRWSSWN